MCVADSNAVSDNSNICDSNVWQTVMQYLITVTYVIVMCVANNNTVSDNSNICDSNVCGKQ